MADPKDIINDPFQMLGQKGAQNLAATGSTGMKPVDTSIQANFLLQRGLATGSTPDEIMSSAQNQTQELQKELQSQLIAATTNSEMTPAQMVASSILQIAPILIGAGVSGKAGAMVGAKSGYAGSNNFLKLTETSRERTRQNAALQAKSIQSQIDSLSKQYQSAQTNKMNADLKREMAEFGRQTSWGAAGIRAQGDVKAAGLAKETMASGSVDTLMAKKEMADTSDRVAAELESLQKEGVSGGLSFYLNTKFDQDSKDFQIQKRVRLLQRELLKAYNKGASSDPDAKEYERIVQGDSFFAASPASIAQGIRALAQDMRLKAAGTIDSFRMLQTGEGVEAFRKEMLDKAAQYEDEGFEAPPLFNTDTIQTSRGKIVFK